MLAIYTRLSVEDEASNSIANQLHEGNEFAQKHQFKDPVIYNEGMGVSGRANIIDRPKLSELIQDIEAGQITTVWVRHQNRIERNGETFHILADALKRNKVMIWYGDTKSDYNDAGDYFHSSIISAVNQYHANLTSQQIKRTLHSKAKQGKSTGNCAYGYMSDDDNY